MTIIWIWLALAVGFIFGWCMAALMIVGGEEN